MDKSAAYRLGVAEGLGMQKYATRALAKFVRYARPRPTAGNAPFRNATPKIKDVPFRDVTSAPAASQLRPTNMKFNNPAAEGVLSSLSPEARAGLLLSIPAGLLGLYMGRTPELPDPGQLTMPFSPVMPWMSNQPTFPPLGSTYPAPGQFPFVNAV